MNILPLTEFKIKTLGKTILFNSKLSIISIYLTQTNI